MKYWLTTQWPHLRTTRRDAPHNDVWVADGKRDVIAPMDVGDLVWIYESQSGRPIVQTLANGEHRIIRHHHGRGGVVTLVEVTAIPAENPEAEAEQYADGSSIWWRWRTSTRTVNSAGFIKREALNAMLGYSPKNALRGFGTRKSGLMAISRELHHKMLAAFLASYGEMEQEQLRSAQRSPRAGLGGEGEIHKSLKDAIAADPAGTLGEPGLELVRVEYPFGATGDRIDVLLRDSLGRYVAVEVEPECRVDHIAGPLQCMKYRALLSYQLDRELDEVRACLVTHQLDHGVRARAERHGITCIVVPYRSAAGLQSPASA